LRFGHRLLAQWLLFFINGLGASGAFTELPTDSAVRSLRPAAQQGFEVGVMTTPFLSFAPTLIVFAARRFITKLGDISAGALGAVAVFSAFVVWVLINPLDPLLGGIIPLVLVLLLIGGSFTGFLIGRLHPRATPSTRTP
jgi:hypothetical protein